MGELLAFIQEHEEAFKSKARISSLYSDFTPLKSSNPDGYKANVSAWSSALIRASREGMAPGNGAFTLKTGEPLEKALETKTFGRPLAMATVLAEAVTAKDMFPLQQFLETKSSIHSKKWAPALEDIAIFAMSLLGYSNDRRQLLGYDFVMLPTLEEAAKKVIDQVCQTSTTPTSLVYTMETFSSTFSKVISEDKPLSTSDLSILLAYLFRDKKAVDMKVDKTGTTIIKFSKNPPKLPDPIDENESTIAVLHSLSMNLTNQTQALESRIDALTQTAKEALSKNQKARATQALRLRKLAETTLRRRQDSLMQVSSVLESIDDAINNRETVNALERSSAVLQDLNEQIGGVERVERVMEGLQDGMADVQEVSDVMSALGAGSIDEAELDEELEALERENAADKAAALPSVPRKSPTEEVTAQLGSVSLSEEKPKPVAEHAS